MAIVFVEPKGGGFEIRFVGSEPTPKGPYPTKEQAVKAARVNGHEPLVAPSRSPKRKGQPRRSRDP
jgi:hypothetical protein